MDFRSGALDLIKDLALRKRSRSMNHTRIIFKIVKRTFFATSMLVTDAGHDILVTKILEIVTYISSRGLDLTAFYVSLDHQERCLSN